MRAAENMQRESQASVIGEWPVSEELVAKIWAEVLRRPHVEADANFFDIGGDSLKAMEVISRVTEVLRVDLPVIAFFEDPTVTHLASVVDELKAGSTTASIPRVSPRTEFPLSYSQQVFWLLEQQNPGTGLYNTARVFRIRGNVDSAVLERSLNELRRRHEILRVRFIQGIDGPVQVVETGSSLQLPFTDLSALGVLTSESAGLKLALETVREPFDLVAGSALRARLIRLAAEDWLLCMAIHHCVSDGFTGSILLDELCEIYDAFEAGHPSPLQELELHFTDYAVWERQWMRGSRLERELDYWRSALQGAPSSLNLPSDFGRLSEPDRRGRLRSIAVAADLLQKAQQLAQANGTTLFTVLATAFRILLFRWSGQTDFLLGTIASNRSRSGTERVIGCFVNPLPLRNPVTGGQSVRDLLSRETQSIMDAFAHQDCPFTKIVEAINPERTSNDNPLFNVALLLQNFPAIDRKGRCFHAEQMNFDAEVALLDLRFIAMETCSGLRLTCEYKNLLFREETIETLLEAYAGVLEAVASDPEQPVAGIVLPESLTRQAAEARAREYKPVVAIAASFTATPVEAPLTFLLSELGMNYRVVFAPYQQVFQQLLDPASLLRTSDGFKIILARLEDWLHSVCTTNPARGEKLPDIADELIIALRAAEGGPASVIVCFCPGSSAVMENAGMSAWLHRLEAKVADAFADSGSVHVVRSKEILDLYPVERYVDEYAQRLANVPYTADFFSALGTTLARRMWSIAENRYLAIAIDCDGVLWTGCRGEKQVVADESRIALQKAILKQRNAGLLLCLCSKNSEEDVWTAFESDLSMPIGRHDIVATAIGSATSDEKLRGLATELGLDLDRFIFLNADPTESSVVEAACPEVLTLQAPTDPDDTLAWLKHVWAFDRWPARRSWPGSAPSEPPYRSGFGPRRQSFQPNA